MHGWRKWTWSSLVEVLVFWKYFVPHREYFSIFWMASKMQYRQFSMMVTGRTQHWISLSLVSSLSVWSNLYRILYTESRHTEDMHSTIPFCRISGFRSKNVSCLAQHTQIKLIISKRRASHFIHNRTSKFIDILKETSKESVSVICRCWCTFWNTITMTWYVGADAPTWQSVTREMSNSS